MKKFLNRNDDLVAESLVGFKAAHPDTLRVDLEQQIVVRIDAPVRGKVGVVSGGGSGHEPLHAGFVGPGMLDAACVGPIFTSPTPEQILTATRAVDGGAGVLYIIKNYTGDVINFGLAAALARDSGIETASVFTDDDVALERVDRSPGRRGTALTVIVQKIAGAMAEAGGSLDEVAALASRVNAQGRTIGVALTSCVTPASGKPTVTLAANEIEFGVGIHGEPGRRREYLRTASEIVCEMAAAVLDDLAPSPGAQLLAFVNGFGATPLSELYLLYGELEQFVTAHGYSIVRRLVGSLATSLDMAGASISLLVMDDALTALWDAPVSTPGLAIGCR